MHTHTQTHTMPPHAYTPQVYNMNKNHIQLNTFTRMHYTTIFTQNHIHATHAHNPHHSKKTHVPQGGLQRWSPQFKIPRLESLGHTLKNINVEYNHNITHVIQVNSNTFSLPSNALQHCMHAGNNCNMHVHLMNRNTHVLYVHTMCHVKHETHANPSHMFTYTPHRCTHEFGDQELQ